MQSKPRPRREFIQMGVQGIGVFTLFGLAGCGRDEKNMRQTESGLYVAGHDITMYDMNAMATYFDGGLGPTTGVVKVDYVVRGTEVSYIYWHGHGGVDHKFKVLPEHFAELKKLKRVYIKTTEVDGHSHKLFIDPVEERYRVPGAQPVIVHVED